MGPRQSRPAPESQEDLPKRTGDGVAEGVTIGPEGREGQAVKPVRGRAVVAIATLGLVVSACSAFGPPELSDGQRSWCLAHSLPDLERGPSVAGAARRLGIASPEVERAVGVLEATYAEGARLATAVVEAEVGGDATTITEAREAYTTWQAQVALPAQEEAAAAVGAWSTTLEWAEACAAAWEDRSLVGPEETPAGVATAPPAEKPTPTPEPTLAPEPTPRLVVNDTLRYTSRTSVGRLIELTLRVRNPGELKAGRLSVQVEGDGYVIRRRTPIVGCRPDCRTATGAEGVIYVEWLAPAPGKAKAYTVQLRAKQAGTYRIDVRAYRGPAGDPLDQIGSWTVKVVVR